MPPRILFVDDEASVHFAVSEYFGARGDPVDCAPDAKRALQRLATTAYGVVIADLRLSWADQPPAQPEGLAFIERVRCEYPATRVLVLSACGDDLGEEALRRGADRFMQKPQPLRELADAVDQLRRRTR